MTDLFITDKLKTLLPRIQAFVHEEVVPVEKMLQHKSFIQMEKEELLILRQKAKKEGLWAPHLSEKEGGLGLSLTEFGQVSEVLGYSPIGHFVFNCQAPDIGNMELLHKYASSTLKDKYLQPLQQGEIRSCFSMTEPEFAGSNPTRMATTALKEGNEYVINGHKWFTSSADGASFAVVMAVTDTEERASTHAKASMIIVPTDNAGFKFIRNISIMGEAGSGHSSHAEVRYENCRVPLANLVGKEGEGFKLAQERLGPGRIHHCMRWIGICERAFEMMCIYAAKRELAINTPIASKQIAQQWIAQSRAEINAARYMVLHTAYGIDKNGAAATRVEISTIKFFVANVLKEVLDRAIQVHGGLGITDDTILSSWYRHERAARIYDGPDEVHQYVVAREELKKYGVKL
jgi:alkylation response protein AidB-like acyl-CoA dehydrogenase